MTRINGIEFLTCGRSGWTIAGKFIASDKIFKVGQRVNITNFGTGDFFGIVLSVNDFDDGMYGVTVDIWDSEDDYNEYLKKEQGNDVLAGNP